MKNIIKVGNIKDRKLVGSKRLWWDLDYNLAIIIRDSIRELAEKCQGYPMSLSNEEVDDEVTYQYWKDKLNYIADCFDTYLKEEVDLLSAEEATLYNQYLNSLKHTFKDSSNGSKKLEIQYDESIKEEYYKLCEKASEIKEEKLKEGLRLLTEHWSDLWD